jgi:hypothetical protein
MKKFLKFVISIAALAAGIVGVLAGIKLLLDKMSKKNSGPVEQFSFEGDELEMITDDATGVFENEDVSAQ